MGVLDNSNWLRSFLGTQFGTAQNNAIPTGESWQKFLELYNTLLPSLNSNLSKGNATVWGDNGIGAFNDTLSQYQKNLPQLLASMVGGNGQANDINAALLDSIFGNTAQVNNAFAKANAGYGPGQDLFATALSNMNNPYNQGMGDIGNYLLSTLGANPYNQDQQDMSNYGIRTGGWDDKLNFAADAGKGLVNNQGVTDLIKGGVGLANNLVGQGQGTMGAGMGMVGQGMNYQNPALQQGTQQALNIVGNNGVTPNSNFMTNFLQQALTQGGNGNLQSGFDFANKAMAGGAVSDFTTQGGNIALDYARGGGPSIYSEMPSWLQNINTSINVGGGGFGGGGGSIGMPNVDSGYTDSLNSILDKAKAILDQNPLMSMNQAVTMARDQAATSTAQQYEAMMGRAMARGGGPGSTVASGLQNRGMVEYADAGSQAESAAMRDAARTQQTLQLQKYGIGADLAKAMEQVAAQRNSASSSLAGQVAGANASLAAAGMNASNQQAQLQAQLQARMAEAQMGLYGQLAGLNLQKMLGGLQGVATFADQDNKMKQTGLAALPELQKVLNDKYGMDLSAYGQQTGQQTDLMKSAMAAISQMQGVNEQARGNMMSTGTNMMGIGRDLTLGGANLYDSNTKTASNNMISGLDSILKASGVANSNLNSYINLANNAGNNQLNWTKLGADLTQNNVNNTNTLLGLLNNINKTNTDYELGMTSAANNLWNTQNNSLTNAFNNNLNLNKFDLDKFTALNNANQQTFGQQNQNFGNTISLINNSANGMNNLAQGFMNYLNTAQGGMYGVNPSSGGQAGWLQQLAQAGIQGATSGLTGGLGQSLGGLVKGGGSGSNIGTGTGNWMGGAMGGF